MAATYEIDAERGLVLTTLAGRVSDDDLSTHLRRLAVDPAFSATMHQLVDLTGVTEIAVTSDGMNHIARASLFGARSRRAIVARTDAQYGMARMFQLLRDTAPDEIAVFRSRREASAWLGFTEPGDA